MKLETRNSKLETGERLAIIRGPKAPTRVFVAASWARLAEARFIAAALRARGHVVVSRWHADDGADPGPYFNADVNTGRASLEVMEDVRACQVLVEITGDGSNNASRGGKRVEFGGALFIGKRVLILGPREHVHHYHVAVRAVTSIEELLAVLA